MEEKELLRIAREHIEQNRVDDAKDILFRLIDQTSDNANLGAAKKLIKTIDGVKPEFDPWIAVYSMAFGGISLVIVIFQITKLPKLSPLVFMIFIFIFIFLSISTMLVGLKSLSVSDNNQLQFGGKTLARV